MTLPPDELTDFVQKVHDTLGKFRLSVIVSPKTLRFNSYCITGLVWRSIRFDRSEFKKLPKDKRGIYAFVLVEPNAMLPPHGYVLYIGIAGKDSDRSLRDRCRDYLNSKRLVKKREGIAFAIGNWREVLHLYYAPVDDTVSASDLKLLEEQLNAALLPPYSRADIEAQTKKLTKAF
ncbi:MAG: hypothetical protein NVV68_09105 [Dokdonella sp.]|nr:hypothetical protein [Dokdonella sp.]